MILFGITDSKDMRLTIAICLCFLFLTACSDQLKVGTTAKTVSVDSFQLLSLNGLGIAQWKMDFQKRVLSKSRTVRFMGICARGMDTVQVWNDSNHQALGSAVECSALQAFEWSYSFSTDGDYPLIFKGMSRNGGGSLGEVSQKIYLKQNPPATPVIVTNNGLNFTVSSSSVTIDGTVSADTTQVRINGAGTLQYTPGSTTFRYTMTLASGVSTRFQFTALDALENESSSGSIEISYYPYLKLSSFSLSGAHSEGVFHPSSQGTLRLRNLVMNPMVRSVDSQASTSNSAKLSTGIVRINSP